jgi:hypothetical protein
MAGRAAEVMRRFLQANGLGSPSPGQAGTPAPPWVKEQYNILQAEGLRLE